MNDVTKTAAADASAAAKKAFDKQAAEDALFLRGSRSPDVVAAAAITNGMDPAEQRRRILNVMAAQT